MRHCAAHLSHRRPCITLAGMTPPPRRSKVQTTPETRTERGKILAGCAGWTIPPAAAQHFPATGSHLERYAAVLPAVEINSSFYRSHRPETYARWAASVPPHFRFSVKAPKAITHIQKLAGVVQALELFLSEVAALGSNLGCLLIQLPPSLAFDSTVAGVFFADLRRRFSGTVACEPRHASWFDARADALLRDAGIARVAADPALVPNAAEPGGWTGATYHRLHGSPKMYYSAYPEDYIRRLAERLNAECPAGGPVWCMFDNTAGGMAMSDALGLREQLMLSLRQVVVPGGKSRTDAAPSHTTLLSTRGAAPQTYVVQVALPLTDSAGKALAQRLFRETRKELTERFGGIGVCTRTQLDGPSRPISGKSRRDNSVIYEVTSEHIDREWWSEYRRILETRFRHEPVRVRAGTMTLL